MTSEIFLAVARHLGRFEGDETKFRSWLFTIAHRKMIDDRRKLLRRRTESRATEQLESALRAVVSAEDQAVDRDAAGVRELLCLINRDQAAVVALRVVVGLSVIETASVLGRTESSVKVLQHRGLNALAAKLPVAQSNLARRQS